MNEDPQKVTPYQSPGVTYKQSSAIPTQKITAVGLTGAVLTAVTAILAVFGIQVPANISGAVLTAVTAITAIVMFIVGYIKKEKH